MRWVKGQEMAWGGWKGRRWHQFSHLRKNNLRLHAQENSHIVKWQGSSDKASYCLFLGIIKRTTISNLHPRPVYQRTPLRWGQFQEGAHSISCSTTPTPARICYQPLTRKGVPFSEILHICTTLHSSLGNFLQPNQQNKMCTFSLTGSFPRNVYGLGNWLNTVIEFGHRYKLVLNASAANQKKISSTQTNEERE